MSHTILELHSGFEKDYHRNFMALDSWTFDNVSQNEALINELKGSLFEFRFGHELSRLSSCENHFLQTLNADFVTRLNSYESWLRHNDRPLLKSLMKLGTESAQFFLQQEQGQKILKVELTGKSHDAQEFEGDVRLTFDSCVKKVSLKLCKDKAFVNTKSGGILSFIAKYFGDSFAVADLYQKELNLVVEQSFNQLGQALYQDAMLGDFLGQFDQRWPAEWLLPGQLPDHLKQHMYDHYHRIISSLWHYFNQLSSLDPNKFQFCLRPLIGLGESEVVQLICYHGEDKSQDLRYQLKKLSFRDYNVMTRELEKASLGNLSLGMSSFEIDLPNYILQIRVKPMNKINAKALKVNCSLKEKE
ncbi:MAG: hypothetical protein Fur0010_03200 [Bdellovibrio sp.]